MSGGNSYSVKHFNGSFNVNADKYNFTLNIKCFPSTNDNFDDNNHLVSMQYELSCMCCEQPMVSLYIGHVGGGDDAYNLRLLYNTTVNTESYMNEVMAKYNNTNFTLTRNKYSDEMWSDKISEDNSNYLRDDVGT